MKKFFIILFLFVAISPGYSQFKNNFASGQPAKEAKKNGGKGFKAKYVILSLILPGAGEWFMGNKNPAKFFLTTEAVLWAGYWGTQAYIGVIQNDYETFAAVHAGVTTQSKDEQYWIDIGNAKNIYVFNEKKRIERNLDATYEETDVNFWEWDERTNRLQYNENRFKEHDWKRRLNIVVGGLILNRLISAVDVIRMIRKNKKSEPKQFSSFYINYRSNRWNGETIRLNFRVNW